MKINIKDIENLENFLIKEGEIANEKVLLVNPNFIGVKWDEENKIFRSSIWNLNGEPVSLGYKKFTNFGENLEFEPINFKKTIRYIGKEDGSCLIISKYKNELIVRTRGSFSVSEMDNSYEIDYFKEIYPKLFNNKYLDSENYSIICEWNSPDNQIVIKHKKPDLILTGCINHSDYSYLSQTKIDEIAIELGVKRPSRFEANSLDEAVDKIKTLKGIEGFIAYCNDDQILKKIKTEQYLMLHRAKSEFNSFERVVDVYFSNNFLNFNEFYNFIEKTFDYEIAQMALPHISKVCDCMEEVNKIVDGMNLFIEKRNLKNKLRKEAALDIIQAYGKTNRSSMLFSLLDDKPLTKENLKKLLYQVYKD